ncbi:hypothetical protein TL16_g08919 [Triparma laevis f. inornata]|uniref:Uncharacterized protein n=1 Tax=Triparma laevis f. inornata TaxID=1714386 RepID=A0A9W7B012_9STRA|nr:hypothetical protein TL16_g08919 [Triparma laevis f. inornata]
MESMFLGACMMEPGNLPKGSTSASTGLESCFFCANCPPDGGECLNGFKRADSINCVICPDHTTDINNNCVRCPDDPFLSSLLSFLVFVLVILAVALLYAFRNNRYLQSIIPRASVTNLIRTKQITAALSILTVFAGLSYSLSTWFRTLADVLSTISMPVEVKPICQPWYENIVRGDNYFASAWMAFLFVYTVSFLLRYAHKFTWKGERLFEISTFVNFQKVATLLMIQAPIIILPMAIDSEKLIANVIWHDEKVLESIISALPSILSFLVLSTIFYLTIRHSSQNFERIRAKLLEAETITAKETIVDIQLHGPYFAAFCLQYTPQMYNHEEKAFLKKFFWIFGMKMVQFVAVLLSNNGQIENMVCAKTAASSAVLVATNLWYIRYLLKRPYASHRPSTTMGDPINDAEILTTRTISMAAALLSLRDTLATDTITGYSFANWFVANKWLMDLFCALLLLFVVYSNLRLFRGLDQDLRTTVSRILSSVRTSSMRDSRNSRDSNDLRDTESSATTPQEDDTRSRAHSGTNEAYHSSIGKMLDEESYRKVIRLQRDLQIDQMSATEGKRWVDCEKRSTMCRKITEGLLLIILLVVVIIGMVVVSNTYYVSLTVRVSVTWLMTLLPIVLYIIMEVLVWRTKQRWVYVTMMSGKALEFIPGMKAKQQQVVISHSLSPPIARDSLPTKIPKLLAKPGTLVPGGVTATASITDEENPQMTQTLEVNSPVHESNTTPQKTTTEMTPPPCVENDETVNPDSVSLEMKEIKTKNPQPKPMIRTPSSVLSAPVSELAKRYEEGQTQQL